MVKDHSDSERGNPLSPHRLLFLINSKGYFICTIPDRIAHTTAFVTPVVEHWLKWEIAQWVYHPMKDRSNDPSHHEWTLLPRSYVSLHNGNIHVGKLNFCLIFLNDICCTKTSEKVWYFLNEKQCHPAYKHFIYLYLFKWKYLSNSFKHIPAQHNFYKTISVVRQLMAHSVTFLSVVSSMEMDQKLIGSTQSYAHQVCTQNPWAKTLHGNFIKAR